MSGFNAILSTIIVSLLTLSTHSDAKSSQVSSGIRKLDFERRTGILIWDVGSSLGIVDQSDELSDSLNSCVVPTASAVTYAEAIKRYKETKKDLPIDQQALWKTGLNGNTLEALKARTVQAFDTGSGSPAVFVLMPETHHNPMISKAEDPYGHFYELHRSQANFMFDLMRALDEAGIPTLNLMEGPSAPLLEPNSKPYEWHRIFDEDYRNAKLINDPKFDPKTVATRMLRGSIWNEALRDNGSMIMARYFPTIPAYAVEDVTAYIDGAVKVMAYYNPQSSGDDLTQLSYSENMIRPYRGPGAIGQDEQLLNKMRKTFAPLTESERAAIVNESCENRSHNMVENALKIAKARAGHTVIFLRFGSFHTKSIVESIKASGASFVLISP